MAKIRRYDELMEAAQANMIAKQDKITDFNEGSVIHSILDTVCRLLERAYVAIRQGYNELLSMIPFSPFKFEKKSGLSASGTVVFLRSSALPSQSIIPKGTKVSCDDLVFITTKAGNIPIDAIKSAPIEVIAEKPGRAYNVAVGAINAIESVVPADVVGVTNENALVGGTNEETDAEFQDRFRVYLAGLSGTNTYAIKDAALRVNAVRSVSVLNHKPPLKDIYNLSVYVDDGSGGATESTINKVKLVIEGDDTDTYPGHLAPGVNVRVLAPTAIPINVSASVNILGVDKDEAETEIRLLISEYINGLTIGMPVVLSELTTKVMKLNYVKDFVITEPSANVEPAIHQIARASTITLSMIEV